MPFITYHWIVFHVIFKVRCTVLWHVLVRWSTRHPRLKSKRRKRRRLAVLSVACSTTDVSSMWYRLSAARRDPTPMLALLKNYTFHATNNYTPPLNHFVVTSLKEDSCSLVCVYLVGLAIWIDYTWLEGHLLVLLFDCQRKATKKLYQGLCHFFTAFGWVTIGSTLTSSYFVVLTVQNWVMNGLGLLMVLLVEGITKFKSTQWSMRCI